MSKIYTKTGDKGETGLFGGKRVSKSSFRVEAYGTMDELNSAIGIVIAQTQNSKLKTQNYSSKVKSELEKIQNDLFEIGAVLATPEDVQVEKGKKIREQLPNYLRKRVKHLEKSIDRMTKELPQMRTFILPGGSKVGSFLHLTRSISRRAERQIVSLSQQEEVFPEILVYLNRLSDFLFTMARFVNHKEKEKETVWKNRTIG